MGLRELLCAVGFAVIFECLTPMIAPRRWKEMLAFLQTVPEHVIQRIGIAGVVIGLAIVWLLQSDLIPL
ncbi:MAG: DUF2065 domain-containing protein [Sutterellaceae bacterium]|nr:DUF2065 domain-containing protein [Sutterellaceae bacterium]MDD7441941.1 DUF2065 domain-containing protein [Sutterellaceae bacterium]MDY2867777.1 DUF2065 domain-containing protein [Mesosutterella sp.]